MFKDIRLKKSQNSAHNSSSSALKSALSLSPTKHSDNAAGTTISGAPTVTSSRKSMESDTSMESILNSFPMIKGTVTHEWGNSLTKKKNSSIIKLNNEDGTPLTSPIKISTTNSPTETLAADIFEDDNDDISRYLHPNKVVDRKRKTNRSARILSNDQFLNIDIVSTEDLQLLEKINNGRIYESPGKKRVLGDGVLGDGLLGEAVMGKEMVEIRESAVQHVQNVIRVQNAQDVINAQKVLNDTDSFQSNFNSESKDNSADDDNYTVLFSHQRKGQKNAQKGAVSTETSLNPAKDFSKNRSRSVSASESIISASSDVSESSQFSFQFAGRNPSVKYYAKSNIKKDEMTYFDNVYGDEDEDDGVSNGSDNAFLEENDVDGEEDEEYEEGFGNGFSTIAQISDADYDDDYCDEDEGNEDTIDENFLLKNSAANALLQKELFGVDVAGGEDEEDDDDDELLTPLANENGAHNLDYLLANGNVNETVNEEENVNVNENVNVYEGNHSSDSETAAAARKPKEPAVSTVSSYRDFFDLSDPEDFGAESRVSDSKSASRNELNEYTNDSNLEKLIEELDESLRDVSGPYSDSASKTTEPLKTTSPLFSSLLRSPKMQSKKHFGYAQLYGKNSLSAITNDSHKLAGNSDFSKPNLAQKSVLKYHDLNTDLDSNIPKRMRELFFIDEEEEEEEPMFLQERDESEPGYFDDLVLDEINEVPEDYDADDDDDNDNGRLSTQKSAGIYSERTFGSVAEVGSESESDRLYQKSSATAHFFSSSGVTSSSSRGFTVTSKAPTKSQKYTKLFNKGNLLVARNDKPQNNKMSIKSKTITFFKRQTFGDNSTFSHQDVLHSKSMSSSSSKSVTTDADLSPIQERRGSVEE